MKFKTDGAKIRKIESVCDDWLGLFQTEKQLMDGVLTAVVLPCISKHARDRKKFDVFEPIIGALIAAHIILSRGMPRENIDKKKNFATKLMTMVLQRGRDMADANGFGNLDSTEYCDAGLTLKAYRFVQFQNMPRNKQLDTLIDFVIYHLARQKLLKSFLKNFAKGGN